MEGLTDHGGSGGPGSGYSLIPGGTWWEVDRAGTWRRGGSHVLCSGEARPSGWRHPPCPLSSRL